jgi:hypothetical protein
MIASDITSRARLLLNDIDATRWVDSELFKWINDAQKLVAMVRPDASVATFVMTLIAGTRQTIPSGGFRLLDIVRNVTTVTGSTPANQVVTVPGRSVRIVDREVLDTQDPYWHTATGSAEIKHFIYDNRSPTLFYVYPPATTSAKLEVVYSVAPTDVAAAGDTLSISDIYQDVVLNYVLYRAYSKDAEYASNAALAGGYLNVVNQMLGIKTQKDVAYSPDLNSKGSSPAPGLTAGGV